MYLSSPTDQKKDITSQLLEVVKVIISNHRPAGGSEK